MGGGEEKFQARSPPLHGKPSPDVRRSCGNSHSGDNPGSHNVNKKVDKDNQGFAHGLSSDPLKPSCTRPCKKSKVTPPPGGEAFPEVSTLSLPKWCAELTSQVLRSRSAFSSFLSGSIQLSRGKPARGPSAPTFFPIPCPVLGCFDRMPGKLSSGRMHSVHTSRAVHVICMALNFWHAGGRTSPDDMLLRGPNKQHRCLYERIRSLLKSDGLVPMFSVKGAGRRFPELTARLSEISILLTSQGISSDPYDKSFHGVEAPKDNSVSPELSPYRDLDPGRLLLHGTGTWDPCSYLDEELTMAFREPKSILCDLPPGPRPSIRDSPQTVALLANKWDKLGLLRVHREQVFEEELVRVFNVFKNHEHDRQIGDRRGRNSVESKLIGPSSSLPSGVDIQDIFVDPKRHSVFVSITDRKDYYHQLAITASKSLGNTVGPSVAIKDVEKTMAYALYLSTQQRRRYSRERQGDKLGSGGVLDRKFVTPAVLPDDHIWVSFNSVFQGDHTGVEVATASHVSLLQSYGLLDDHRRLVANKPLRSSSECQGLVIDDFFALSVEPAGTSPEESKARKAYDIAQMAYSDSSLLGSPSKDVAAEKSGKLIGAFVNGKPETLARGLCTLGAPPEKRYALSHLTFEICKLSHTTDSLHLCLLGAWVSILCYRRPLMALLNHSFRLVDIAVYDANRPKLLALPRKVACELVLVATLAVFAVFDMASKYDSKIYCTDASSKKGAIVSAEIEPRLIEVMWKGLKSKGAYTRLLSPSETILKAVGELEPSEPDGRVDPPRPIAFHFDFIEVFAGASLISSFLSSWNFVCGPPVEISSSAEFNVAEVRVIEWLTFLVSEKRLLSFFLCPPCTTFSIMRRPALRSQATPYGFCPLEEKTSAGNVLAHRSMQLMYVGAQNEVPGIAETPWSSFMKHLPAWRHVACLPVSRFCRADSCRFGSPHQKAFRFLSVHLDLHDVSRRCQCKTKHLQIQGKYTKGSAIYTKELAMNLALCFKKGILEVKRKVHEENSLVVKGLENQLCNEIVTSSTWTCESSWTFRKESHINILEMASVLRLVQKLSDRCCPLRVINLVDSHVTKGAASKGRTASHGLGAILRRLNAHLVASSIFLCVPFVPTRLNPSDDPTRDREVRGPLPGLLLEDWTDSEVLDLLSLPPTRRWSSNWIRIILRILGPQVLRFHCRNEFRQAATVKHRPVVVLSKEPSFSDHSKKEFDATLGFPGEGWNFPLLCSRYGFLQMDFASVWCAPFVFVLRLFFSVPRLGRLSLCWLLLLLCFASSPGAMAMPLFPVTTGEKTKADQRRHVGPIPVGRPVLPTTGSNRQKLLSSFLDWAKDEMIDFEWMLNHHYETIDEINLVLARYGRLMYDAGKSYNSYAELLNSVTSWKPAIRRLLQGAWDLGYSWKRLEPGEHHIAMPPQILLSMISTAILWGWLRFSGCLAIGFAGLLRPGELLAATRADLLLPSDCGKTIDHALLSIREPKSRFTNARHQSAKIDIPDLLELCELSFSDLSPLQRLWPHSGQTFRSRFKAVLSALSLPIVSTGQLRALDPGSLRAGGAIYIISTTENGELCRRRGRWANFKMMEIYVQELNALLYFKKISELARTKVLLVGGTFPEVLKKAQAFVQAKIPLHAWRILFSR